MSLCSSVSSAGHARPDVGRPSLFHHQTLLVEVLVHVGHVLRHHQLRHLQGHTEAAGVQDAEVGGRKGSHRKVLKKSDVNIWIDRKYVFMLFTLMSPRKRKTFKT